MSANTLERRVAILEGAVAALEEQVRQLAATIRCHDDQSEPATPDRATDEARRREDELTTATHE
jgi:hypothetical protein